MPPTLSLFYTFLFLLSHIAFGAKIDRKAVVSRYNPTRNASSTLTPMQVGNGNFAFGADVTGLQTFQPFAILSSWGWKNDSLPTGRTLEDVLAYKGTSLDNHGLNVTYMYGGVSDIQQWLISNPNRVNLGRIGLLFLSPSGEVLNITETDIQDKKQALELWSGLLTSSFTFNGSSVTVTTTCAQDSDTIGVEITSPLLQQGRLGVFLDFPWNDGSSKFSAPFVGRFNMTANHSTTLHQGSPLPKGAQATITHNLVNNSFITTAGGSKFTIRRDSASAHRYTIVPASRSSSTFSLSIHYSLKTPESLPSFSAVHTSSTKAWQSYWTTGGFVDLITGSTDSRADELQRRIVLSQYLLRVNEAGDYPPQEVRCSGFVAWIS